jgi:hypothetical protein
VCLELNFVVIIIILIIVIVALNYALLIWKLLVFEILLNTAAFSTFIVCALLAKKIIVLLDALQVIMLSIET